MPVVDPILLDNPAAPARTGLVLVAQADTMPAVVWAGPVPRAGLDPAVVAAAADGTWPCALLPEHATGWFGRPGLSGHRAGGRDWSARFRPARVSHLGRQVRIQGADEVAGLALLTEIEAVPGGAIRGRHTLTNTGPEPYVVDSLEIVFPLPGEATEAPRHHRRPVAS